jgi:two-component sensor histidine kinase
MFCARWITSPAASTQYPWLTTSSQREDGQIVKLPDYLRALCLAIKQQAEDIEIDVQADELGLSIDRAVPLGLILNEAATNSLKHAFGPDAGGRISVKLVAGVTERVV